MTDIKNAYNRANFIENTQCKWSNEDNETYTHEVNDLDGFLEILGLIKLKNIKANLWRRNLINHDNEKNNGTHDDGSHRPFHEGIWYRGQNDFEQALTPSIFRTSNPIKESEKTKDKESAVIDEFHYSELNANISLRLADPNFSHGASIDMLTYLRHYELPTRLLDWSSAPLIALYFAVDGAYESFQKDRKAKTDCPSYYWRDSDTIGGEKYATVVVMNANRLNGITSFDARSRRPNDNFHTHNILRPRHFDVYYRSIMSEYLYYEDVMNRVITETKNFTEITGSRYKELFKHALNSNKNYTVEDEEWFMRFPKKEHFEDAIKNSFAKEYPHLTHKSDAFFNDFIKKSSSPVAFFPRRNNNRIVVQQGLFTIHGGKIIPSMGDIENYVHSDCDNNDNQPLETPFIDPPYSLNKLNKEQIDKNGKPFLFYIKIPIRKCIEIKENLKSLGVHKATIYPEFANQSHYATKKWRNTYIEPKDKDNE